MRQCRIASRVALGSIGHRTSEAKGRAWSLATKVLCSKHRLFSFGRAAAMSGSAGTVATTSQPTRRGAKSVRRLGGVRRLGWCSRRFPTSLLLSIWSTKGGRS